MNPLIKKYGKQDRWVNFVFQTREGKITKVPFSAVTGKNASSMKASDWTTFEEASKTKLGKKGQLGIVFTEDKTLLGIDLDHCLNGLNIEHAEKEKIVQLIIEADTYTEISPSGTGLHLFLETEHPLELTANRHGNFEAYTGGRYFTFTGRSYKDERDIRKVSVEEAEKLLAIIGYPWGKASEAALPVKSEKDLDFTQSISRFDQNILLKKIFSSKGGEKIKALYDGDTTGYKKDGSAADMALLAHLAFWTRKDASAMEAIWLQSPLGQREKTQERKDYRDRSIRNAIAKCTTVHETTATKLEAELATVAPEIDLLFQTYKGDKIFTQNTENICRILQKHPDFAGRLRYDTFKNIIEYKPSGETEFREFADHDVIDLQTAISILFPIFGKVGKEMVYDAITKTARENTIDSAVDYLRALKWDGVARLNTWLEKTFGTPDDLYHRAVGSNVLKGLVMRLMRPGCKFDYVLVLEGEQGMKKSSALAILGGGKPHDGEIYGPWHVETTMGMENKDFFMQFWGKAIVEFSEGETLSRTEVKRMKGIITTPVDRFRPAYGRQSIDFPRRCIFMMTTNQSEYLKDETGNRRWLPVKVEKIADLDWLYENHDQLYAEAFHRVMVLKETTYDFPVEETLAAQHLRRIHDPNEDNIAHWYFNKMTQAERDDGVTIYQAFRDVYCNGMTPQKGLDRGTEMAIAGVLRDVIKLDKRRKMIDGIQGVRWFMKEDSMKSAIEIYKTPSQKAFDEF